MWTSFEFGFLDAKTGVSYSPRVDADRAVLRSLESDVHALQRRRSGKANDWRDPAYQEAKEHKSTRDTGRVKGLVAEAFRKNGLA